jgi:chitodextrinase
MKKLFVILMALLFIVMAGCSGGGGGSSSSSDNPEEITSLKGTWSSGGSSITFMDDNTFTVEANNKATADVWGTYSISGNELTITYSSGSSCFDTATQTYYVGHYTFSINGNTLTLTLMSDNCVERVAMLTGHSWTIQNASDTTAPSIPTNLNATAVTFSQINLTWSASSDNVGVTGYKVFRNGGLIATTSETVFPDTGLTSNTTYSYNVSAYDAAGNDSGKSVSVSATTIVATTPTYSISGTVNGAVAAGVTITLTGTGSKSMTTDSGGNYTFTGAANGNYTITPSKTGFSFSPSSISATVNNANLTEQNFMAESPLDSWQLRYDVPGVYQRAVTYAMGKFFSVGTAGRKILTSPDGITWNEVFVENSNDSTLNAITYANNRLVSVGHFGKITYSLDGVTWTNLKIPPRNITIQNTDMLDLESITYGNDIFVAVGYYGTIVTSPDGITWTHRKATDTTPYTNATLYGVTYGNNKFVAVGYNYDHSTDVYTYVVLTSSDGMIWDSCTSCIEEQVTSIAYGNNIFVAVGPSDNISTSIDGINWTSRPSGTFSGTPSASNPSNYFNFITYENNEFIAVGHKILSSTDGITWSKHSAYDSGLYEYGAAYGNNCFIIVGDAGIYQSGPINSQ